MASESRITVLFAFVCASVSFSASATYYVNGTIGNDAYDGLTPEPYETHGPKRTIQAAIAACGGGDEVVVADGTYRFVGNCGFDFADRQISLLSENGAPGTRLESGNVGRYLYFSSGESASMLPDSFHIVEGEGSVAQGARTSLQSFDPDGLRILFIGNSYTFYNGGLDNLVADLAEAAGFPRPYVEKQVVGGYCLTYHSSRPETLTAIDSRDWDYIVLQEYSVGPTHFGDEPRTPASFMNAVRTLNARIEQNNAANGWNTRVVLYETWAREPGVNLATGRPAYPNEFASPSAMQAELRENYFAIANEIGAIVVPCGDAWEETFAERPYPSLDMHCDGTHPNDLGSYLNGLVFLSVIYGVADTSGLPYQNLAGGQVSISESDARFLQNCTTIINPSTGNTHACR